jgi:hypothetical protein
MLAEYVFLLLFLKTVFPLSLIILSISSISHALHILTREITVETMYTICFLTFSNSEFF